jgi:hypothetical protein
MTMRCCFPLSGVAAYNERRYFPSEVGAMPLSGEAIRLMNYIDDVSVTLRRVLAFIPTLTPEERARVYNRLRESKPSLDDVAKALEAE